MTDLATLVVKITTDAAGFVKGVEEVKKNASMLERGLTGMAAVGGTLVTAGFAAAAAGATALAGGLVSAINAASEAEKVQAQLNAVLQSTGGIAGVTADMANQLADSLSRVTMFEDEAILSAENLMLTFTNIGKDIFPTAIETALDMSQALGQDLQTSVIQLGKALQDPIIGITALRRVGVNFNDAQVEMIKGLVESGNLMEAQKMILRELQTEFGGSARAAGETFAGQLTILRNQLGNVMETIGNALLPHLKNLSSALIDVVSSANFQQFVTELASGLANIAENVVKSIPVVIQKFQEFSTWLQNNKPIIAGVLTALGAAIAVFVYTTVIPALASMIAAAAPVIAIMAAIGLAGYVLYRAWTENWGGIRDTVTNFWNNTLKPFVDQVVQWFQTSVPAVIEWLRGKWDEVWNAILAVVQRVQPMIDALTKAFLAAQQGDWYAFGQHLREYIDLLWENVKSAFSSAWEWIKTTVTNFINDVVTKFKTTDWAGLGKSILEGIKNGISSMISSVTSTAKEVAQAILDAIKGFLGIKSPAKALIEVGKQIIQGIIEGISDGIKTIAEAVGNLLKLFIEKDWLGTGRQIVDSISSGMNANISAMTNAANAIATAAAGRLSGYNWSQVGKSIASQIASGVSSNSQAIANAISGLFSSTTNNIGYNAWKNVGYNIVAKIAEGINEKKGTLTSAISSLMGAAYVAAYNLVQNWDLYTGGSTTPPTTPLAIPETGLSNTSNNQINVNIYANVANEIDIEELAYRVASRLRVYV